MPRSDLRRVVDVVDREGDARMPISLGRVGSVSIASGWMYSNSSMRPLPSGVSYLAMLASFASWPTESSVHSPLTVSRPTGVDLEDEVAH